MNFFSPESRIMQIMTFLVNLVILQFLLIITSLPLFTVGTSVTAAFSVMKQMEKDVYLPVLRTFFREFKSNFKQSTVVWLIIVAAAVIVGTDIVFFMGIDSLIGKIGVIFGYLGIFFLALECLYVFPLMAWFDNSASMHMRNALKMALANFGRTLMLLGLFALVGLFVWEILQFVLLFGLTVIMYIEHTYHKRIFKKYIPQQ